MRSNDIESSMTVSRPKDVAYISPAAPSFMINFPVSLPSSTREGVCRNAKKHASIRTASSMEHQPAHE